MLTVEALDQAEDHIIFAAITDSGQALDQEQATRLFQDVIFASLGDASSGWVVDYFGGSGTTGHAVINLNREDDGKRKYLLVEMGAHFETVLVPRLKKVVYSTDWKEGKPQSRNTGISHAFKVVRLESYEDTLNNLHLHRTAEQETPMIQNKTPRWEIIGNITFSARKMNPTATSVS